MSRRGGTNARRGLDPEVRRLLDLAAEAGAVVEPTASGHWRILVPGGGLAIVASSPSCSRSTQNCLSDLAKAGLDLRRRWRTQTVVSRRRPGLR